MIRNLPFVLVPLLFPFLLLAQQPDLVHLSSYTTDVSGSAEVVAYDKMTSRAFFTSAESNKLTIIDISDPLDPTLFLDVDLSTYGGAPNSVAIYEGLVAVAMENIIKTSNGMVVFFDNGGNYLGDVMVGALPDMLTFTPDGNRILVANEGEPDDEYAIDPEGSVSIVDLSAGMSGLSVSTINFSQYDDKKFHLINKGIRIFGNNGDVTVSQDMEPEYIAVTEDGTKAYVNCQENNAFVVIDLNANEIVDIQPLGYKNHLLGTPSVELHILNQKVNDWPSLGTPVYDGGQPQVMLGGFSGMFFDKNESTENNWVFYIIPDRGPNSDVVGKADVIPASTQNVRPFKLPDYQARIVKVSLDVSSGGVTLNDSIFLVRNDSITPISGKGNIPGFDEVPVTYADTSTPYGNVDYISNLDGEEFHALSYDEFGGDFEGILRDTIGNFWMCDEYRPAIYKFDQNGILIERFVPKGTSLLGTTPMPEGTYGKESLPGVYAKRRANRGFEAIAYDDQNDIIYAFIQSPLYNPNSETKDNSDVIRILGINPETGETVAEYVYLLENNKVNGYSSSRVDKIGDAVFTGNGKLLVLERDSEGPAVREGKKFIFEIDLNVATNIYGSAVTSADTIPIDRLTEDVKPLEMMTADEIRAASITPVYKHKVVNLPTIGYESSDKAEGIALLPNNQIAVLNDNDFGLAGAGITDNSVLGIIRFADDYGFDASDKDGIENITNHPTLGMFMPDGIASYEVSGVNYIVTVNEGDSRDYDGYSEETRVKDLILDSVYYPDYKILQEDAQLGRLKTTTATGDYDGDGEIEQIYSYGARSFSIFDEYGNIVYDSGDDFAQTILMEESDYFNEDDGEKDSRSDDKGGEPEAVTIGTIGEFTYAFIGLERQSAIMVYDISNPFSPKFITYYNNRMEEESGIVGDVSPEIIQFIPASDSPNDQNLLLVGYEVSGSVGIIQIDKTLTAISKEVQYGDFKVFPNPLNDRSVLNFDTEISGIVYNLNGQQMMKFEKQRSIDTSSLRGGVYIVKSHSNGTKRFVKF